MRFLLTIHTTACSIYERSHLFRGVDLGDVGEEVEDTARVAPLIIVPRDNLDEVVVEGDASLGIEDGRSRVADHISRDDIVLGVFENACDGQQSVTDASLDQSLATNP